MVPSDEALPSVLAVNDAGRPALDPDDFDVILFMGARIRSLNIFEPELRRFQQPEAFTSQAVFAQTCADWLRRQRFYGVARAFAKTTGCDILVAPSTFLAEGSAPQKGPEYTLAQKPNREGVDRIWTALEQAAAEDGITLIRQPPETCGDGCTSKPEYSRRAADDTIDPVHRNPAYGALILERALCALASRQGREHVPAG
ncbi:hypothetical protein [Sulfitobacter aestuariivivens]|uniref:hypothetical protein n=1 Tax=Sulfitobacter aestuariivivens TaxID=2766981 RepID=UPI0036106FF8